MKRISPPLVKKPPEQPAYHIKSTSQRIVFSVDMSSAEKSQDLLFFVPPEREINISFLDYTVEPEQNPARPQSNTLPDKKTIETLLKQGVTIKDICYMRFNRVVKVTIRKRFSSEDSVFTLKKATAALEFDTYDGGKKFDDSLMDKEHGFGKLARHLIVNYRDSRRYADPSPPCKIEPTDTIWTKTIAEELKNQNILWKKLRFQTPGFYKISYRSLHRIKVSPREIHPKDIKVFCDGKEVPTLVVGGVAQSFTENDNVIFYATKSNSKFTPEKVYWLRLSLAKEGETPAKNMEKQEYKILPDETIKRRGFFIASKRIEEDKELKIQTGNFLAIKGMRWVGDEIGLNKPYEVKFDLPYLAERTPGQSRVTLRFYNDEHIFKPSSEFFVRLNEYEFPAFRFSNYNDDTKVLEFPTSVLRTSNNQITITIKNRERPEGESGRSGVYFDNVEVEYPRRFVAENGKITIDFSLTAKPSEKEEETEELVSVVIRGFPPNTPVIGFEVDKEGEARLLSIDTTQSDGSVSATLPFTKNRTFHFTTLRSIPEVPVPEDIKFENLCGETYHNDYIIISHKDFIEQANRLAELKRTQGFSPLLVDVEAIYNEFTYGEESPVAIKKFLRYALTHWQNPLPRYVLFVGDCTSDYLHLTRNEVINYVPSYKIERSGGEEWASDHWFTTLCGEDEFADIILGRISVNNVRDAQTVITKIIKYETEREPGLWHAMLGYVADDGEFDDQCEDLRKNYTPPHYGAQTVYLERFPWEDNFYLPKQLVEQEKAKVSTAATSRIKEIIDNGVVMLSYYGHGSPNIWADERMWFGGDSENSDNLNLRNGDKLPFIINMTCNSGAIDYPVPKWNICISEDFMRVPKGGAIGLYVPAGPGFTSQHKKVSTTLRRAIFRDGFRRVGDCIVAGQYYNLIEDATPDMIKMFILLCDPTLSLQLPASLFDMSITPIRSKPLENLTFVAEGNVPGIKEGTVTFWLTDPENIQRLGPIEKPFSNFRIHFEFKLPEPSTLGEWILHAYCTSTENPALDALGKASVWIDKPYLQIVDFQEEQKGGEYNAGKTITLITTIKNPTAISIDDAVLSLWRRKNNGWEKIDTHQICVPYKTKKKIPFKVVLKEGVNLFRVQLENYKTPPIPTIEPLEYRTLAISIPYANKTGPDIVLLPELFDIEVRNKTKSTYHCTVKGTVYNPGSADYEKVIFTLKDKEEKQLARQEYSAKLFTSGKPLKFTLQATLNEREQLHNLQLTTELLPETIVDVHPENNVIQFSNPDSRFPDLSISSSDISFPDPRPTEGVTVFIDVQVHNQGESPARNFYVAAYDNDPAKGGQKLPDFTGQTASKHISYLAPHSETTLRLRWDPVKNQGERTIWVKVDDGENVLEQHEDNNVASAQIYVKKKAILRPGGIFLKPQTPEEKRKGILRLQAVVKNIGETDARNIFVEFFKTEEHSPENMIGKVFVPLVKAGSEEVAEIEWRIKPEERHLKVRPSYRIFLKGSLQRISSVLPPEEQ